MTARRSLLAGTAAVALALTAALAFESVYTISIRPRRLDPILRQADAKPPHEQSVEPALPLRLVDSGGVGIPLADWGTDYSHDRRSFRDVILDAPPYVDAAAFARVEQDWRAYVTRMREYGNNAIAIPMLLELVDFDRLRLPHDRAATVTVYEAASRFRARHDAVRRSFGPLLDWTSRQGMQVFLDTDMLALTPPLAQLLHTLAPGTGVARIDASNPVVWQVYGAALDELFDTVPSIQGVVVRFGEGGRLYSTGGWPYYSEVAVRDGVSLKAMLRGLLPVFEAHNKTFVLRSWTVGVGQIGRLHIDPAIYDAVLGDIDSPALIVSTKFTAGDFFSYLPLNPTLAQGRHRRLVEVQAKPEFEGFNAFPDFLGEEHARALTALRSANPQIVGTYVLPQFGGPLRAGPRTLYPLHGFWLWTDANVFVASRLAADPRASVRHLVSLWAEARFGRDPRVVEAVAATLFETREAVLTGFYIRPFAERDVRVPGLELPPLMWIFEWDMVGGWHSLLSLVYHGTRDQVDRAIAEGHAAAATVRRTRQRLGTAFQEAGPGACGPFCEPALRSLEYQETLFDALAAWRQAFLSYYRWLETGDRAAWAAWRDGRGQFEAAATVHVDRFGHDATFPAFDLTSAARTISVAERGGWERGLAATTAIVVAAMMWIGSTRRARGEWLGQPALLRFSHLTWTGAATPWRLDREQMDAGTAAAVTVFVVMLVGLLVAMLTGFTTARIGAGSSLLIAVVAVAFESTAVGVAWRRGRGHLLVACSTPLLPGLILLCALLAYLGPLGFWYSFWTSSTFRMVFLTILLAMPLWTAYVMIAARVVDGWPATVAGCLAAAGAGLLVLHALLPGWADTLRYLDRPLNFAPATETMVFALRNYAGVSLGIGGRAGIAGLGLLAVGYALWLRFVIRASGERQFKGV